MAPHPPVHAPADRRRAHPAGRLPGPASLGRLVAALAGLVLALTLAPAPAQAANPTTPRNFTGYGFDQCLTPTQAAMDAWLLHSPFWAVGIYISGDSRACRNQPNLTPAWVSTQLAKGWRLLPITLGPQASCATRFPRYGNDETVNPSSADSYAAARRQGRLEAADAVAAAKRLGIGPGSTLWYDMEAYDTGKTACRESALYFTSAWTTRLHALGYVSGVYSSASSHIKAMDDARRNRPAAFAEPDRIWIARWDGVANTSTSYIPEDGWRPGGRMKQYRGGHDETHGGVRINIDSNFLDLGRGSVAGREPSHCGSGVRLSFPTYPTIRAGATGNHVRAAQCLLTKAGYYKGPISGSFDAATGDAARRYRIDRGIVRSRSVGTRVWVALHSHAVPDRVIKYGAAGERVRRLQRALNAASSERLAVSGVFEGSTAAAVKRYQSRRDLPVTGVVTPAVWSNLRGGRL